MNKINSGNVNKGRSVKSSRMPIGQHKDVEFSEEVADHEDWEALERSEQADARQKGKYRL